MRLHEDEELFRQALMATADYFKIDPAIVEKDYYVTIFLEALARRLPDLLFKGGTSLSKCYKSIMRFSEDLDLTLVQDNITQGQRKRVKQAIKDTCKELGLLLLNEEETKSRRDFNRYEIDYAPTIQAVAIKPILLIETTYIVKSYPSEKKMVSSLIYDYLCENQQVSLAEQYELSEFSVSVQRIDRTLIDKIFAICDYYLMGNITEHSRHIYDIYQLLRTVPLDDNFKCLFQQVRQDRKGGSSYCVSAQDQYDISLLLQEVIEKDIYKNDYKNITEHVLFENVSYEEAITGLLQLIDARIF